MHRARPCGRAHREHVLTKDHEVVELEPLPGSSQRLDRHGSQLDEITALDIRYPAALIVTRRRDLFASAMPEIGDGVVGTGPSPNDR